VPPHRRELFLQCRDLRGERQGSDIAGQQPQPVPAAREKPVPAPIERRDETLPGIDLPVADDRLRAPRVLERQD
jgi:hypothetical protein